MMIKTLLLVCVLNIQPTDCTPNNAWEVIKDMSAGDMLPTACLRSGMMHMAQFSNQIGFDRRRYYVLVRCVHE